jgi:hypothetical protein
MELNSGYLGKVFGGSTTAASNIGGLALVLLVLPGIVLPFFSGASMTAVEYWKTASPIMTLIFGYLFGKNT